MKKQMKLRNTILITTSLISAVIVLVFGAVSNHSFQKLLTERMVEDSQETMNATQKNVETVITYMEDFTKYMALDQRVSNTIAEYENMTEENRILKMLEIKRNWDTISNRLIFSTSMIYSLEIYAENDLIYSYYDDPMGSEIKNVPDEILQKAISQSPPIWTDLLALKQYRSYAKKTEYGFAVVKSVRNEYERRNGAIAVYLRESSLSDILEMENKDEKNRFYLVNGEDTILSGVDKEKLYCKAAETLGLSEEEYEKCVQDGMLLKEQRGQDPLLYMSRSIGKKGIKLVGKIIMDELTIQQQGLTFFMGIMLFFALVLAGISAWFVSNRITKPLGELMDIMEKIKTDEKSTSLRFPKGNSGEIGVLGSRFNELMDELDASMQQIYEEQRQRRHNEVRLLQAQIVPHFLYNTMGIISSFIKLGMKDQALKTIQNLVSFYRLSLSSGNDIITIKEEVELTRDYMELQQLRYIEYMEYHIECEEEAERVWIPKLTIQPLMENVLHHGLKLGTEKCQIHVSITLEEEKNYLRICVHDNGAGIRTERLEQLKHSLETGKSITKSFGISNINQRLKLLYGEKYHMEIESAEGEYTQFILFVPLENKIGGKDHV